MARYYDNSDQAQRFQPGTTVRSDEVDGKFDSVASGFSSVETDVDRSLKLVADGSNHEVAATATQRRNKVIGFDGQGTMALLGGFSWRGDYASGTEYFVNDVFRDPATKNLFVVDERHTGGATIDTAKTSLAIDVDDVEAAKAAAESAQSAAETAQSGAEDAQGYAEEWAVKAEDSLISTAAGGNGVDDYSALHHANKASGSASAAATSETNAAASESAAAASESAAATSESNAATSETNAAQSASAAATSESNAASSASAAATSESNAQSSENAAASSASSAATSETNAANSATAAASSETNAQGFANDAANSATAASNSAGAAQSSATAASSSATQAANSESAAATSASNAANSESAAATSESNAATSETNAAASESAAATSESNAATSETNAANSASAASTSETNAANSASAAATSESNAATSASNAATSETNAANSASAAASSASEAQGYADSINPDNIDINGGTIDNTDIGETTPALITASKYSTTDSYPTIKPSLNLDFANTKTLDPRIDFTRTSTATYYDGVSYAKAEENLFKYSQAFNSSYWDKNGVLSADTAIAPDGTQTADSLTDSGDGSSVYIQRSNFYVNDYSAAGNPTHISVFVKPNGRDQFELDNTASGGGKVEFDISSGTVISSSGTFSNPAIIDVGNGWFRVSAIFGGGVGTGRHYRFSAPAGDPNTGVFIWGAQWEIRDQVTAYTPTTDQPITNYIPILQTASANVARFDHDPITGESKGLLIEEQRTNLLTYSEDFADASWSKVAASIDSNAIVAPDGSLTADKLVPTETTENHFVSKTELLVQNKEYVAGVYIKKAGYNFARIEIGGNNSLWSSNNIVIINLTDGSYSSNGAEGSYFIQDAGNGWWRVTWKSTFIGSSGTRGGLLIAPTDDINGNANTTGDGFSGIYIWGAQLEEGSFPTSYIKTEGSQVTRAADSAEITGTNFSEWYRQDEGTLFSVASREFDVPSGLFPACASIYDDGSNRIDQGWLTNNVAGFVVVVDGVQQANIFAPDAQNTRRLANAFKKDDFASSVNGKTALTNSDGILPLVSELKIGAGYQGQNSLNGHIKKLAYYPARLPDATLQTLTEE